MHEPNGGYCGGETKQARPSRRLRRSPASKHDQLSPGSNSMIVEVYAVLGCTVPSIVSEVLEANPPLRSPREGAAFVASPCLRAGCDGIATQCWIRSP